MKRRSFIAMVGCTAAAYPLLLRAQSIQKRPLVAWMSGLTRSSSESYFTVFLQGMRELEYTEGRDFDMLYRFADGRPDRIPAIATEVVSLKPDLILATAVDSVVAVKKLTSTIPIVSGALADPVHLGLIESEARPGGNVTGIEPYLPGLPAKQIELAREIIPGANKIGLLTNLNDPKAPPQRKELLAAAESLKVQVIESDCNQVDEVKGAVQALADAKVRATIVLQTSVLLGASREIANSALELKLPTVFGYRVHVVAGGLISYGIDLHWCFYRAASFVHKILRGAQPADLPIEFPTKLVLVINLKTAKALGLTVPPTLLARADEVIE